MADYNYLLSNIKFYTISHLLYDKFYENNEYIVSGITFENKIMVAYIKNNIRTNLYYISIFQKLPEFMKYNFRNVIINKIDTILVDNNKYTIFVNIIYNNKEFLFQFNIDKDIIIDSIIINELYNSNRTYLGYSDINIIYYIDNIELKNKVRGLMYIDTKERNNINNCYIKRIKAFCTYDEKLEAYNNNIINENELNNIYPIIDQRNHLNHEILSRLPSNIEKHYWDFSSCLGILKFKN